jgi:WD40 repeat protein
MFRKCPSVFYVLILLLGTVSAVFAQETAHPVISVDNAGNLEQIIEIIDENQRMSEDSLVFSPDSTLLAYVQDSEIQLLDVTSNEVAVTVPEVIFPVWLVFTDDGKGLTAVTTSFLEGIFSWDASTGERLPAVVPAERASAFATTVSPDGSLIAASRDDGLRIIETATGETVTTLPATGRVAISADNKTIAIGDANTKIELWDIAAGELRLTLESPSLAYEAPVFSMDSTLVAGCNSNDGVDIWDAETGEIVQSMPDASCGRGAFSPDNSLFVTGFFTFTVYDVATGEELFTLPETGNVAFSPDGTMLATISTFSATLRVWSVP